MTYPIKVIVEINIDHEKYVDARKYRGWLYLWLSHNGRVGGIVEIMYSDGSNHIIFVPLENIEIVHD